ncbi:MAG: oligosaccharide flippase family protein [Chloroflexi bacterium]|nr:oligosaccharide flippase family protein [Chloroflexota bacterium]
MSRRDLLVVLLFLALAAFFFAPVVLGSASLVPFDNLYRFPPWDSFATQFGITTPHNELVSDLVLENYAWKQFIVESLRAKELPLWNPYLFGGVPFLAAGQSSALYPFSVLFYLLPIDRAFGYFVALQLALAAITMFIFMRVWGLSRFASIISAITFAFSGFFVVSTAFPMVISAAAWLPAILACVELILRAKNTSRQLVFAFIGAILIGIQFLAGHVEISMYILIVTAFYSFWRTLQTFQVFETWKVWSVIAAMTAIGITLGAVQIIPLFELVQNNFRSGSASFQQVVEWAYKPKQIITFFIPDFFGNPTSHSYFDVFDFTMHAAPFETIFWGIKNYVEAGSYVGILPIILAVIAVLAWCTLQVTRLKSQAAGNNPQVTKPTTNNLQPTTCNLQPVALFAILAIVSLLFAFGTPLYSILFFGVPGFNQLHSPFRWVFPYTLSMAILAGIGAQVISEQWAVNSQQSTVNSKQLRFTPSTSLRTWFYVLPLVAGILVLVTLAVSWLFRDQTIAFASRILSSSELAQRAFDSGRMFYSYEFRNVALFALFLIGAGIALYASRFTHHISTRFGKIPVWQLLAVMVITADLFLISFDFYPRAEPQLATFTPPAVKFLQDDPSFYRITSYDELNQKMFNPNVGMFYHLSDIRGYDSIIPKQYADLMGLLAPQGELLYNRIAPFYTPDAFDSPIINLLNVKYVLTTRPLPNAGYSLVYDNEIKIYRNDRVLPRAFMVPQARVISDRASLLAQMKVFDPTKQVLLEQTPQSVDSPTCAYTPVSIVEYSGSQVKIQSKQDCAGWLVLTDSYFPGWLAYIDEQDTTLYKADYNFRAVYVPAGEHIIRFKYSPISLRVGIITSFLGAMVLLLGFAYLAWRRFYRGDESSEVHVVAKNSILPMATSLLLKVFPFALALLSLRILGPTGTGRYAWAATVFFFANTITDFGLGILVTREISRDRSQANRYLTNTIILRVILWAITLVPFMLVPMIYGVATDAATAFALLMIGLLPSSLAASFAFLFNAYERFEYRVAVDFTTQLLSFALQVIALLLGYGIVGLATASIITNLFTLIAFVYLVRRSLFIPHVQVDRTLIRWMFFESYPLMLNNLLSSLFFRIDILILQPLKGDAIVGYYKTAYSFIDNLNFIPSNFTLAIFPALTRYAVSAKEAMLRAYIMSLKILLWIALPITVGTIFIAPELITFFGGDAYLPHSAIALRYLIWFLPFSFINSVTHYVLIALGQQRFLTKAFVIGVVFNVSANLVAIPELGYVGAALVTVFSEMVLLIPFYYSVRKNLASVPFWSIAWRPVVASGIMGLALWWMLAQFGLLIAVPSAGILYVAVLIALGVLGEDERALLRRFVPQRLHQVARIAE